MVAVAVTSAGDRRYGGWQACTGVLWFRGCFPRLKLGDHSAFGPVTDCHGRRPLVSPQRPGAMEVRQRHPLSQGTAGRACGRPTDRDRRQVCALDGWGCRTWHPTTALYPVRQPRGRHRRHLLPWRGLKAVMHRAAGELDLRSCSGTKCRPQPVCPDCGGTSAASAGVGVCAFLTSAHGTTRRDSCPKYR